jgi:cobalt-zinc-cadmium efflux system membrane fusion protein
VFVQVAPWTFERRAVTVADDEGADVRVVSGLAAGDTVVVSGGVLLND